MLLVDTYLDRSPIAGIGVFTRAALPEGTPIWAFNPAVDLAYDPAGWERFLATLAEPVQADMRRHSYKQGGVYVLCIDNARFMNHAREAANVENEADSDTMYARCDIPAGTELLCDYYQYSDADDPHLSAISASMQAIAEGVSG